MHREPPCVLVIAGSDSSGGAGLTRDVRVLADLEVAGACAVTVVTAQTDARVISMHPVPALDVHEQIRAALEARDIRAVKIGMLGSAASVEAVAQALPPRDTVAIVLDPVLAASSGGAQADTQTLEALRSRLLPAVTLLTPNVPEAAMLLGDEPAPADPQMTAQARRLQALGPEAVLIKGGHSAETECVDLLVSGDARVHRFASARHPAGMRGTGCALSSAIAAGLALGMPLAEACRHAKRYVSAQLAARAESDGPA